MPFHSRVLANVNESLRTLWTNDEVGAAKYLKAGCLQLYVLEDGEEGGIDRFLPMIYTNA